MGKAVAILMWAIYITGMTIYSWFTAVEDFTSFIMSIYAWAMLAYLPLIIFPD